MTQIKDSLSVIIPARNEIYLQKTIDEVFLKARGPATDVVVILDGWWPNPPLKNDDRLHIIHRGEARGLRDGINSAVALSKAEHIMKLDAHCMLDEGFDVKLMADCLANWVSVPRRKRLLPETWELEIQEGRPDVDYMYLTYPYKDDGTLYGLHGKNWDKLNKDEKLKEVLIDDLMSAQGSCWFMHRDYFYELELMDKETYGNFWDEFLEIGMKCWLSGGRVVVNKKTWYAHWHKNKGRGYNLPNEVSHSEIWMQPKAWHKQSLPLEFLIKKFDEKNGGVHIWPEKFYGQSN